MTIPHRPLHLVMYGAQALITVSGLVLFIMLYLMEPVDEFAVVHHPWQPHVLHLHVLAAPIAVFLLGMYAWSHAVPYLRGGVVEGRRSGWGLLAAAAPMVISGSLIQVSVEPWWRNAWILLHLITSFAWVLLFAGHGINHFLRNR